MPVITAIVQAVLAIGLVGILIERGLDRWSDRKIRADFMRLLFYEVLINKFATNANISSMDTILAGNLQHTSRAWYSYEAWEIVKGSSKVHLLSPSEWNFFIEQYVQTKKHDEAFRTWHKSSTDDKLCNLQGLGQNKDRVTKFIERLDNSPFLRARIRDRNEATETLIEKTLSDDGLGPEEIRAVMWSYKRNRDLPQK